jgi:hypothetical protein
MAPVKFEENIKSKLEDRRIQPSIDSWDKLSKQLDEKSYKKWPYLWWLSLAACVTVVLILALPKILNQDVTTGKPILVEESREIIEFEESRTKQEKEQSSTKFVDAINSKSNTTEDEIQPLLSSTAPKLNDKNTSVAIEQAEVYSGVKNSHDKEPKALNENGTEETVAMLSENELERLYDNIQKNKQTVTSDREVDSLLKAAQRAIFKEETRVDNSEIVHANQLLMQIENEVEPSLKSAVYKILKDGYKNVKSAVVQRNN